MFILSVDAGGNSSAGGGTSASKNRQGQFTIKEIRGKKKSMLSKKT